MYLNSKLKQYFDRGITFDRHGLTHSDSESFKKSANDSIHFVSYLHYILLDGMSTDKVRSRMAQFGYTEVEANAALSESQRLIKNDLGIDLDTHVGNLFSNESVCHGTAYQLRQEIKARLAVAVEKPIEFDGHVYDANAASLLQIKAKLSIRWVTVDWIRADNKVTKGMTYGTLMNLQKAITERNLNYHSVAVSEKAKLLDWAETSNLDKLNEYKMITFN